MRERTCCGYRERVVVMRCNRPTCSTCRNIRGKNLGRTLGEALNRYQQEHGLYAYFLTLTFRDTETLRPYGEMLAAVKKLMRLRLWKRAGLHGTVRAFENKVGSGSGLWHSHFHIVLMTERPIDTESGHIQDELRERWLKLTGDSFILDLRPFDGGYREVFKYVMKDEDNMTDEQLQEFVETLMSRKHRFLALTGELYNNPELRRMSKEPQQEETWASKECCCPNCGADDDVERIQYRIGVWNGDGIDWSDPFHVPTLGMSPKQIELYARGDIRGQWNKHQPPKSDRPKRDKFLPKWDENVGDYVPVKA